MPIACLHPQGVLVDDETYNAVESGSCGWEPLDPIKVKGKEELVKIFRPSLVQNDRKTRLTHMPSSLTSSERYSSSDERTSFASAHETKRLRRTLGRLEEQKLLRQGLAELTAGKGGAILLQGEAGMGKTHLVDVLRTMHEKAGAGLDGGTSAEGEDVEDSHAHHDLSDDAQVGLILNASKPIEATTPFFMWKGE